MSEVTTKRELANVAIVGTGPAGYTAAIYAARSELKPLVFEGSQPGGQLTITTEVENYPGFPEGVTGPELMEKMRAQAERFGSEIIAEHIVGLECTDAGFKLTALDSGNVYTARSVILCMGASAKLLGIQGESHLMGYGVSACATCDGFFAKGQEILVVGGGDSAMEEATFLSRYASKITIVHRREELRASKIMIQRAKDNPTIEWALSKNIKEIHGDRGEGGVTGATLIDARTGEESRIDCKMVFMAIGHRPNSDLVKGLIELDDNGYVKVQPGSTKTTIPGLFAAGDLADSIYRQAVSAAGTGCMAALDAERWLAHT